MLPPRIAGEQAGPPTGLEQAGHWDAATRKLITARTLEQGPLRFFNDTEARTLTVLCDLISGQQRRREIPVLCLIDERLVHARMRGFRYAGMPDDRDTWRRVARGLDRSAAACGAADFSAAPEPLRLKLVGALAAGELSGEVWDELPPALAWKVVAGDVLEAFYSHPLAWREIGFGGPAYPRGYARLRAGQREGWQEPM